MNLSRRDFIKTTATLAAALSVPPLMPGSRALCASTGKTALAIVTGDRAPATRKALDLLGGMRAFVKPGSRVVVKPNMSFPHPPERATNTHPEVVATIASLCIEAGAREVLVLDFPFNRPEPCLENSGIREACSRINNVHTLAIVEEKFFRSVPVPRGRALREVKILKDVLDADVFINVPTAKSHTTTGVSLGLKGLMGVIWDRGYFHSRVDINQAIADLGTAVRIDLTVLDASRALVNGGPSGPGKVEFPNMIIAGTDPVAVDAMGVTTASWYGQQFAGPQVRHIVAAHELGLGAIDLSQVNQLRTRL